MYVIVSTAGNDLVLLFINNGEEFFTEQEVSNSADHANSVFAADLDEDGDMDILSASGNDNRIAWYQNVSAPVIMLKKTQ